MNDKILLGHGSGGILSHNLIKDVFIKNFNNNILNLMGDSSLLKISDTQYIAITTDSFVVDPIFFPGGDIGKLAVCGTVNDLAVSGAKPLYITSAFIIEEGFPIETLNTIVESMAKEAKKAGVEIVAGDTKVVNKGKCDKVFINTTGIGIIDSDKIHITKGQNIKAGDKIIINGTIGDHGMTIMKEREFKTFNINVQSDCACLNVLINDVMAVSSNVHFMRDATRGGLASVLCEIAENKEFGISIDEKSIKVTDGARGMCEVLGIDPLYVANEGKVIMIVASDDAEKVLSVMKKHELGKDSVIIGDVSNEHYGMCWMNTEIGGKRIIDMLSGEQLPRIC